MNMRDKQVVYRKVKARVEEWYRKYQKDMKGRAGPVEGYCLWWAYYTVEVLKEKGTTAVLQAGTAYWPRLLPEQDDGKPDTHPQFGYQYEPGPHNHRAVMEGRFPEVHCWAGIPRSQVIVDMTAGFFPKRARELGGYDWPGPTPPPFYWGHCQSAPEGVVYMPHMEAIELMHAVIALSEGKVVMVRSPRMMSHGTTSE